MEESSKQLFDIWCKRNLLVGLKFNSVVCRVISGIVSFFFYTCIHRRLFEISRFRYYWRRDTSCGAATFLGVLRSPSFERGWARRNSYSEISATHMQMSAHDTVCAEWHGENSCIYIKSQRNWIAPLQCMYVRVLTHVHPLSIFTIFIRPGLHVKRRQH